MAKRDLSDILLKWAASHGTFKEWGIKARWLFPAVEFHDPEGGIAFFRPQAGLVVHLGRSGIITQTPYDVAAPTFFRELQDILITSARARRSLRTKGRRIRSSSGVEVDTKPSFWYPANPRIWISEVFSDLGKK